MPAVCPYLDRAVMSQAMLLSSHAQKLCGASDSMRNGKIYDGASFSDNTSKQDYNSHQDQVDEVHLTDTTITCDNLQFSQHTVHQTLFYCLCLYIYQKSYKIQTIEKCLVL